MEGQKSPGVGSKGTYHPLTAYIVKKTATQVIIKNEFVFTKSVKCLQIFGQNSITKYTLRFSLINRLTYSFIIMRIFQMFMAFVTLLAIL